MRKLGPGPRERGWEMELPCGGEETYAYPLDHPFEPGKDPCGAPLKIGRDDLFIDHDADFDRYRIFCRCTCGYKTPVPVGRHFQTSDLPGYKDWLAKQTAKADTETAWAQRIAPGPYDSGWTFVIACTGETVGRKGDRKGCDEDRVPCGRGFRAGKDALCHEHGTMGGVLFTCPDCHAETRADAPLLGNQEALPTRPAWRKAHGLDEDGPRGLIPRFGPLEQPGDSIKA